MGLFFHVSKVLGEYEVEFRRENEGIHLAGVKEGGVRKGHCGGAACGDAMNTADGAGSVGSEWALREGRSVWGPHEEGGERSCSSQACPLRGGAAVAGDDHGRT